MDTAAGNPALPLLLMRHADLAGEQDVVALLSDGLADPLVVAELVRHHGVLVLCDLTLPSAAPPVAAAAFRFHQATRTVQLAGIGVRPDLRRRGLGRRLLTSALTWLRADGFEQVHAFGAGEGGAIASLLASAGFAADGGTAQEDGRSRLVLLL